MPSVESAPQSQAALPFSTPVTLSTLPLSDPPGYGEQKAEFSTTGGYTTLSTNKPTSLPIQRAGYPITSPEVAAYQPGGDSSSSGNYPPQPSGVALANFPEPQKRRGRFWGGVCLLLALLLIAGSATVLLTHPRAISGAGPQQNSPVSLIGSTN